MHVHDDEAFDSPEAWEACWCYAGAAEWPGSKDRDGVDESWMKLYDICLLPKGIPEIVCCRVEYVWILVWWPNELVWLNTTRYAVPIMYLTSKAHGRKIPRNFWLDLILHQSASYSHCRHLSTVLSPKVWRPFLAVEISWICRRHWHLAGIQVGQSTRPTEHSKYSNN